MGGAGDKIGRVCFVAAPDLLRSWTYCLRTLPDIEDLHTPLERVQLMPSYCHYRAQLYTSWTWAAGAASENGRHWPNTPGSSSSLRVCSINKYLWSISCANEIAVTWTSRWKWSTWCPTGDALSEESVSEGNVWWGEELDFWKNV